MVKGRAIDVTQDPSIDPPIGLLGKESGKINEQQDLEETCANASRDDILVGERRGVVSSLLRTCVLKCRVCTTPTAGCPNTYTYPVSASAFCG